MTDSPSLLPHRLRALAGRALEAALNHAVELDSEMRARLHTLQGQGVLMHLRGPELHLYIRVEDSRLRVGPAPDDEQAPTLRVAASPGSLLAMALQRGEGGIAPGRVEIAGDASLARQLEKLAHDYAPDIEEAFAQRFGDVLGVPLARTLRHGLMHAQRNSRHAAEDVADWLREESRLTIATAEMDAFLDDVDVLRERAERLDARLQRLHRQWEPNA